MSSPLPAKKGRIERGLSVPQIIEIIKMDLEMGQHFVFVDLGAGVGLEVKARLRVLLRGVPNSAFFHFLGETNPLTAKKTWFVSAEGEEAGAVSWDTKVKKKQIMARLFRFRIEEGEL